MSDFIPKLELVLNKAFDAKKECVICGKRGDCKELVSQDHGRQKVKEVRCTVARPLICSFVKTKLRLLPTSTDVYCSSRSNNHINHALN